jgi:hypothetical protein
MMDLDVGYANFFAVAKIAFFCEGARGCLA